MELLPDNRADTYILSLPGHWNGFLLFLARGNSEEGTHQMGDEE
jgi:hypothetical protein